MDIKRDKPLTYPTVCILNNKGENLANGVIRAICLGFAWILLESDLPGYQTWGHIVKLDASKLVRISQDSQQWHPEDALFTLCI